MLIEGLSRLEYRGYDSAGIAVLNDADIKRVRAVGRVMEMQHKANEQNLSGFVGIGHTRWATHGSSEEHTSELQSLMSNSYAVFCLKKKKNRKKKKYIKK